MQRLLQCKQRNCHHLDCARKLQLCIYTVNVTLIPTLPLLKAHTLATVCTKQSTCCAPWAQLLQLLRDVNIQSR